MSDASSQAYKDQREEEDRIERAKSARLGMILSTSNEINSIDKEIAQMEEHSQKLKLRRQQLMKELEKLVK